MNADECRDRPRHAAVRPDLVLHQAPLRGVAVFVGPGMQVEEEPAEDGVGRVRRVKVEERRDALDVRGGRRRENEPNHRGPVIATQSSRPGHRGSVRALATGLQVMEERVALHRFAAAELPALGTITRPSPTPRIKSRLYEASVLSKKHAWLDISNVDCDGGHDGFTPLFSALFRFSARDVGYAPLTNQAPTFRY